MMRFTRKLSQAMRKKLAQETNRLSKPIEIEGRRI
jgi:hypothetical protein